MKTIKIQAIIGLVLIGTAVAAHAAFAPDSRSANAKGHHPAKSPVRIKGQVQDLYPGGTQTMKLKITNRSSHRVHLRAVKAKVNNASPDCANQNLQIPKKKLKTMLPPHKTLKTTLPVRMTAEAADACQGAMFPLKFKAKLGH